jgi:hypothetical protein
MHILSEDLLDQDHFFEWILASLDKTDSDTLPVWMLVIQAYANSMKRSYFRNQQLLGAMVYQLQKVTRTDSKVILTTLESNIHGVMSSLIANHPVRIFMNYCRPKSNLKCSLIPVIGNERVIFSISRCVIFIARDRPKQILRRPTKHLDRS